MVLDTEEGIVFVFEAFKGLIVEIEMGKLDLVGVEAVGVDCEAVVLGGYLDLTGSEIDDGLVCSTMSEFEFECLTSKCDAEDLMTETDAKDRHFSYEFFDCSYEVVERCWVAGAVGEEETIRSEGEDVVG